MFTGKVELGQGIVTALARIAAEELDVAFERIRVETADTAHGLDELYTSVQRLDVGERRPPCARPPREARAHLLELAAVRLETAARRSHRRGRHGP